MKTIKLAKNFKGFVCQLKGFIATLNPCYVFSPCKHSLRSRLEIIFIFHTHPALKSKVVKLFAWNILVNCGQLHQGDVWDLRESSLKSVKLQ